MFLGGQLKLEERRPVETLEKDEKPRKWWILFQRLISYSKVWLGYPLLSLETAHSAFSRTFHLTSEWKKTLI